MIVFGVRGRNSSMETHTQYDEETLKNSDLKVCRFVSKGGGHMKGLKTAQALKEI